MPQKSLISIETAAHYLQDSEFPFGDDLQPIHFLVVVAVISPAEGIGPSVELSATSLVAFIVFSVDDVVVSVWSDAILIFPVC